MTLAALISAYHESSEPGGLLRATLPLAGRTLVERQARLAASVGANPVVILVERLPGELVSAIDRLRSEGINAVLARNVSEAAEAVHPQDRLLLVADGLIADEAHVLRLIGVDGSAILTMPDHAGDDRFERIDAHSRWAGLALIDGDLLKRTAAMLHDWDLQSTLLRRSIQGGARQFAVRGEPADDSLAIAERLDDLHEAELQIVEAASAARDDWVSIYLLAPIERAATRALMPSAFGPDWVHATAATLLGLATLLFARDWLWAGSAAMLLATPLDGIAERLAALRQSRRGGFWRRWVMPALGGAALLSLCASLAGELGWGCIVLGAATIAFLAALSAERRGLDLSGRRFLAERKGLTWLMLPFAVTNYWAVGLGAIATYAAGSFFWAQRRLHRPPPPLAETEPKHD